MQGQQNTCWSRTCNLDCGRSLDSTVNARATGHRFLHPERFPTFESLMDSGLYLLAFPDLASLVVSLCNRYCKVDLYGVEWPQEPPRYLLLLLGRGFDPASVLTDDTRFPEWAPAVKSTDICLRKRTCMFLLEYTQVSQAALTQSQGPLGPPRCLVPELEMGA